VLLRAAGLSAIVDQVPHAPVKTDYKDPSITFMDQLNYSVRINVKCFGNYAYGVAPGQSFNRHVLAPGQSVMASLKGNSVPARPRFGVKFTAEPTSATLVTADMAYVRYRNVRYGDNAPTNGWGVTRERSNGLVSLVKSVDQHELFDLTAYG
jgi:hypothetical protein